MNPDLVRCPCSLLLLALEAGDEHLFGPLCSLQIVLEHSVEERYELLVALGFGILDVGLERLYVIRGLVEHRDEVVVLILGLPGEVGHLFSLLRISLLAPCCTQTRPPRKRGRTGSYRDPPATSTSDCAAHATTRAVTGNGAALSPLAVDRLC